MTAEAISKSTISERMVDELKEFIVIAAYLFVCFSALAYLKYAILQAQDIAFAPFGFAAAKALICAKFMSVGHAMHLGERYKTRALIWPTLYRSLVFLALLLVLNVLEEVAVGLLHHRTVAEFDLRRRRRHAPATHCDKLRHSSGAGAVLRISLAWRSRRKSKIWFAYFSIPVIRARPPSHELLSYYRRAYSC